MKERNKARRKKERKKARQKEREREDRKEDVGKNCWNFETQRGIKKKIVKKYNYL